jgi:2,4-dienoyl-CoA reductase-like NADH-dependent reductase (Old Yellow Enzyme family)
MSRLFEPSTLAGMKLRNRSIRSATWEGLGDPDGFVRPELPEMLAELARGCVGLIVTGYLYVSPEGRALPWQTGIWQESHVEGLSKIPKAVHGAGGLVAAQIVHAGANTLPERIGGKIPLAPSAIKGFTFAGIPKEMTISEIKTTVKAFAKAAQRVKQASFDALQLHAAHGYLISQFLSPLTNKRTDEYGGSHEKRLRFLLEVYGAVREAVGQEFPVLMKLNTMDGPEGGITLEEALETTKVLIPLGLDAVEVSGGIAGTIDYTAARKNISRLSDEAYFRSAAKFFKKELDIPVILVGGIRSFEVAQNILLSNHADYISFSRPLICEPDLIFRWMNGDLRKSKCVSCNQCLKEGLKGSGIVCMGHKQKNPERD